MSEVKKATFVSLAVKAAKDVKIEESAKKRSALHKVKLVAKVYTLKGKIMEAESELDETEVKLDEAIGSMEFQKTNDWLQNVTNYQSSVGEKKDKVTELKQTKEYLEDLIEKYF